jgi:predicted ATP-binding protein involved in virulence
VHIRKLKIRNVRGFGEVDLDFSRPDGSLAGWTVLAGRNGSGKSTLLKTIALAASGVSGAAVLHGSFVSWLRVGANEADVEIEIQSSRDDLKVSYPVPPEKQVTIQRWNRREAGSEPLISSNLPPEADKEPGPWWSLSFGWFLAGYGPYRRLSERTTDEKRLPARLSRLVSLFRAEPLMECVEWLQQVHYRKLDERPGAAALEQVIFAVLNDGLLPDRLRIEEVDSEGLWTIQHGVRLPLERLSDGYRATAALVLDIVRLLHDCFQRLDVDGSGHRVLNSGVVLIDEVDLHLHVSWQKQIGFWLKRHFPNIQFIVTTHSPFVCQAADARGLIRLPAPGENRTAEHVSDDLYNTVVNGSLDDAVLTELFGLETPYSEPAERLREDIARLEAKLQTGKASDQDRRKFQDLRSRLPHNLSTDVEQALRKLAAKG